MFPCLCSAFFLVLQHHLAVRIPTRSHLSSPFLPMSQDLFGKSSSSDWLLDVSRDEKASGPDDRQHASTVEHQILGVSSSIYSDTVIITHGILVPNSYCKLGSLTLIVGKWDGIVGRDFLGFSLYRPCDGTKLGTILAPDSLIHHTVRDRLRRSFRISVRRFFGSCLFFLLPRLEPTDHIISSSAGLKNSVLGSKPLGSSQHLSFQRRFLDHPDDPVFADPDLFEDDLQVWIHSEVRVSEDVRPVEPDHAVEEIIGGEWKRTLKMFNGEMMHGFEWENIRAET